MILQDLLLGMDLKRVRLVRHNISREDVAKNYEKGDAYFQIYQSLQKPGRFGNSTHILSFLGTEGTNGIYLGCYKIVDCVPALEIRDKIPSDFFGYSMIRSESFYVMEKTKLLADLEHRLVIDWGKSTRGWCQRGTTTKEILEIRPKVSSLTFQSYDRTILSYAELETIIGNPKSHPEWERRLSSVAGVYLIVDTLTGKQYVGSASGEDGGLWGRWSNYVKTKHGGNKRMIKLFEQDPEAYRRFQYSILEIFPIKRDRHEVLACETLYKKKLRSIEFGLNAN